MLMLALLHYRLPNHGASRSECVRLPPHWDCADTKGNFQLIKVRQPIKFMLGLLVRYKMVNV